MLVSKVFHNIKLQSIKKKKKLYIRVSTRELNRVLSAELYLRPWSMCNYITMSKGYVVYVRPIYCSHIVIILFILELSTSFSMLCDFVTITITCDQIYNNYHDFFIDSGNCNYYNSLTKFK